MNNVSVSRELAREVVVILDAAIADLKFHGKESKEVAIRRDALKAALTQPSEQPAKRRVYGQPAAMGSYDICSHGVVGGCLRDDPEQPAKAEQPGDVGMYYGEAMGANTWDIYRPDGSFLCHIDRPGVFYALIEELNAALSPSVPAEAVAWLSRDEARLAVFQAINAITVGNKTDDKLIVENLRAAGFGIAKQNVNTSEQVATNRNDEAVRLLARGRHVVDTLMGDSDRPEDDSAECKWMQEVSAFLASQQEEKG